MDVYIITTLFNYNAFIIIKWPINHQIFNRCASKSNYAAKLVQQFVAERWYLLRLLKLVSTGKCVDACPRHQTIPVNITSLICALFNSQQSEWYIFSCSGIKKNKKKYWQEVSVGHTIPYSMHNVFKLENYSNSFLLVVSKVNHRSCH